MTVKMTLSDFPITETGVHEHRTTSTVVKTTFTALEQVYMLPTVAFYGWQLVLVEWEDRLRRCEEGG